MSAKKSTTKPTPPKRPLSAYFLFLNEIRPQLKKEHPQASIGEISKLAGERWNVVDSATKAKFEKQSEERKKIYLKEKADYEAKYGPIEKKQKKGKDKDEGSAKKSKKK